MRRQAETEQRQYEAHVERARLHGIHEVNRLGKIDFFLIKRNELFCFCNRW